MHISKLLRQKTVWFGGGFDGFVFQSLACCWRSGSSLAVLRVWEGSRVAFYDLELKEEELYHLVFSNHAWLLLVHTGHWWALAGDRPRYLLCEVAPSFSQGHHLSLF